MVSVYSILDNNERGCCPHVDNGRHEQYTYYHVLIVVSQKAIAYLSMYVCVVVDPKEWAALLGIVVYAEFLLVYRPELYNLRLLHS